MKQNENETMGNHGQERRLLLISCSEKKDHAKGDIPAVQRYDGGTFRVLRKYLTENREKETTLDILILSAKYGLIAPELPIPDYDYLMTEKRAAELRDSVTNHFSEYLRASCYHQICIALSKVYLQALDPSTLAKLDSSTTTFVNGSQGYRLSQLYEWLWGQPAQEKQTNSQVLMATGTAILKGVKLSYSPEEIVSIAERALTINSHNAYRFTDWYVSINGNRISPKWLVSQLSGLPVGTYTSAEARRVLHQIGIEVHQIQKG